MKTRRGWQLLWRAALIVALGAAGSPLNAWGAKAAPGLGVLTGKVVRGPRAPLVRPGQPGAAPVAGLKILLHGPAPGEVHTATTDARGCYRLSLPAGDYRVETGPLPGRQFTKDLPARITITAGAETRLDVHIDTGIR